MGFLSCASKAFHITTLQYRCATVCLSASLRLPLVLIFCEVWHYCRRVGGTLSFSMHLPRNDMGSVALRALLQFSSAPTCMLCSLAPR